MLATYKNMDNIYVYKKCYIYSPYIWQNGQQAGLMVNIFIYFPIMILDNIHWVNIHNYIE